MHTHTHTLNMSVCIYIHTYTHTHIHSPIVRGQYPLKNYNNVEILPKTRNTSEIIQTLDNPLKQKTHLRNNPNT